MDKAATNKLLKTKMKLVYDLKSIPEGLDPGNLMKMYDNHNVVFWDSSAGTRPKIFGVDGSQELLPAIVDSAGKELDLERYQEEFADKEFWDMELHKCKNSLIYFYSNYYTPVWPADDKAMGIYIQELGFASNPKVSEDSDKAAEHFEKQKAEMKEKTEWITIEFLKERKGALEPLKIEFIAKVEKLEESLKDKVRLFDSNNVSLEPKKKIGNLIEKIKKNLPVHAEFSEKYRTKKGKWDIPMLSNTSYDHLLHMLDVIYRDQTK